jgi:hypothetical protein
VAVVLSVVEGAAPVERALRHGPRFEGILTVER